MPTYLPMLNEVEKASIDERQPLPDRYRGLDDAEMDRRIAAARATLGSRLLILGHHYQRDEVIKFADYVGDSFKLSRYCGTRPDAEFVVFCGVHFMAESADVLCAPHQKVILPDLAAGCSMSDMADIDQLETCWRDLEAMGVPSVIPVTYINSSAAIKAFVGEHGGIVCTSGNAAGVLKWAWEQGERILFLPDQHLGRNTAFKMGVPLDRMVVWDPNEFDGGLAADEALAARLLLWKGHCSVHERFTAQQIEMVREEHPGVRRPRAHDRQSFGRSMTRRRRVVERFGQPEIEHLHRAVRPQLYVCRLQVAMDDAEPVCRLERIRDLPRDR